MELFHTPSSPMTATSLHGEGSPSLDSTPAGKHLRITSSPTILLPVPVSRPPISLMWFIVSALLIQSIHLRVSLAYTGKSELA